MAVKRGRTGHQSKRYDTESNETRKERKKKKKEKKKEKKGADVFITCFQKHNHAFKIQSPQRMIVGLFGKPFTLTNKAASIPQVTVKEIPKDKLNSHFANVSHTIITNDKSIDDLTFLKRFCKSTMSMYTFY